MTDRAPTDLETVERITRGRRATRHFRADPIPVGLLERLVDAARWAPSGYNLQPTHFVLVTDADTRKRLCPACMAQAPIREAPAVLVLAGDGRVADRHFEDVLAMDRQAGATSPEYETLLRRVVPLAFSRGPAGFGWLWKTTLLPIVRLFRPIPDLPAVHKTFWLTKQVMLCAMNFMLLAESAGLSTLPMEGFDERRVKKVLGIPRCHVVPVVIAVGYASAAMPPKTRVPLERVLHRERW